MSAQFSTKMLRKNINMYYLINEGGESKTGRQIQADVIASYLYLDSHLPVVQKIIQISYEVVFIWGKNESKNYIS